MARLRLLTAALALLFFVAHVRTLPRMLEDTDTINFALGVESFDVENYQPHPPGYPVYIAMAKVSTNVAGWIAPQWDRDRRAAVGQAVWGLIAGTVAAFLLLDLWMAVGLTPSVAFLASLVAVTAPLFWLTAARPMTDVPGLIASIAVQVCLLRALTVLSRVGVDRAALRMWIAGGFGAGLIVGIRSQTAMLTLPLLLVCLVALGRRKHWRVAAILAGSAAAGVLAWLGPLIWDTGGIARYLEAVRGQGAQDFSGGVEMLAARPDWHLFVAAVTRTFERWRTVGLSRAVLVLTLLGVARLLIKDRRALFLVCVLFGPYVMFHLAFHETVTMRYALPLVVPLAALAVVGLTMLGRRVGTVVAVAAAVVCITSAQPTLEAYAAQGSPVFQALRDIEQTLATSPERPVLRMHREVWWGIGRAIDWYQQSWGFARLTHPGTHEWLNLVRYWTDGNTRPVWFLAEPARTDLRLIDKRARRVVRHYEREPDVRMLIGGSRLTSFNWVEINRPGWVLGTGWSLTPEIGGLTAQDANGPDRQTAEAFVLRSDRPTRVVLGGRDLAPDGAPPGVVSVLLDDAPIAEWPVSTDSRWFVHWIDLPPDASETASPYSRLTVRVLPADSGGTPPPVGLEQFDAAPRGEPMFAFDADWHELEQDSASRKLLRWSADESTLVVQPEGTDLHLVLRGESPLKYYDRAPVVTIVAGDRELGRFTPSDDFSQDITLPVSALEAASGRVSIRTSLSFVPAERDGSADRRRLGLRLSAVEIHR